MKPDFVDESGPLFSPRLQRVNVSDQITAVDESRHSFASSFCVYY